MLCLTREEGQGLVEYGMILVLVAVALALILGILGQELVTFFQSVIDAFPI